MDYFLLIFVIYSVFVGIFNCRDKKVSYFIDIVFFNLQ